MSELNKKKEVIAYHGSPKVFDDFKVPNNNNVKSNYGPAIYFTEHPHEASDYSWPNISFKGVPAYYDARNKMKKDRKYQSKKRSIFKQYGIKVNDFDHPNWSKANSDIELYENNYISSLLGASPNVRKVNLKVRNPFNPHSWDHANQIAKISGYEYDKNGELRELNTKEDPYNTNHYELMMHDGLGWNENSRKSDFFGDAYKWNDKAKMLNDLIQKAGFDSINDKERGHWVIFNPEKIKDYFQKNDIPLDVFVHPMHLKYFTKVSLINNANLNKHQLGPSHNPLHGWITPTGEYHHMGPNEGHLEHLRHYGFDTSPENNEFNFNSAINQGYISIGHGGGNNIGINISVNPIGSPALSTLRKLIADPKSMSHWNGSAAHFSSYGGISVPFNIEHFIKHGTFKKDFPGRLAASEKLNKSEWKSEINDRELEDHIINHSEDIDEDMVREYCRGHKAVLRHTPISEIKEGYQNNNINIPKKQANYNRKNYINAPPIVVENGTIIDGNHRFRAAQYQGATHVLAYHILNKSELNKSESSEVVSIAVIDKDSIMMGKRNDNHRWTLPGGHLNPNEDPKAGALRELLEETGIKANDLKYLGSAWVITFTGKKKLIHSFAYFYNQEPTNTSNDPDSEVSQWMFVNCKHGLPKSIQDELHSPRNITLMKLGILKDLTKTEIDRILDFEELRKVKRIGNSIVIEPIDTHSVSNDLDHKSNISGLDINGVKRFQGESGTTMVGGLAGLGKNKSNTKLVVKSAWPNNEEMNQTFGINPRESSIFPTAQREGVFYNMDRDFWKTGSVPKTSVFKDHQGNLYSAQEFLQGAQHDYGSDRHNKIKNFAEKRGDLHKMAIMDIISGNSDRHGANYMIHGRDLKLIDNGLTYAHFNHNRKIRLPVYIDADSPIPESTKNWIKGLNSTKLHSMLTRNNVPGNIRKLMVDSLNRVKRNINTYGSIGDLNRDIRDFSEPYVKQHALSNYKNDNYHASYKNFTDEDRMKIATDPNFNEQNAKVLTNWPMSQDIMNAAGQHIGKYPILDYYISRSTKNPEHVKTVYENPNSDWDSVDGLLNNPTTWENGLGIPAFNKLAKIAFIVPFRTISDLLHRNHRIEPNLSDQDINYLLDYTKKNYPNRLHEIALNSTPTVSEKVMALVNPF